MTQTPWSTHYDALYTPHIQAGNYPADALLALSWRDAWDGRRFPLADREGVEAIMDNLVNQGKDAYYRVSPLVNREYARGTRGTAEDSLGIPALFLDLDTTDGVHKPFKGDQVEMVHPTREQALELAYAIAEPTLVVASGGGLHAYYRLDKPLVIPVVDQGGKAVIDRSSYEQQLLLRFDAHATTVAHSRGYGMDKGIASDTARILRPAGTVNFKNPEVPKPVTILRYNPEAQYTIAQIEEMVPPLPERQPRQDRFAADFRANPDSSMRAIRKRNEVSRRFEERIPVSFLMERYWNMDALGNGGWVLPGSDGWVTSTTPHAKIIHTKNGKVEMATAYGNRLQEAWGISDYRTAMSSWDLLLVALNYDEAAAQLVAMTFTEPDDDLIETIEALADQVALDGDDK